VVGVRQINGLRDFKSRKGLCKTSLMDIGPPKHIESKNRLAKGMNCPHCNNTIITFALSEDYYLICPYCGTRL
jgi:DNA-directed RNA polymerase subunit RPC12/RpoP